MNTYAYHVMGKRGGYGFGPRPTHCHECGKPLPEQKSGDVSTGYGCGEPETVQEVPEGAPALRKGEHYARSPAVCFACCHAHDVEQLKDRTRPFVAYVSSDGRTVSNWPGGKLGDVVIRTRATLTRRSYVHDARDYSHFRVRDVHGGMWHGYGSPGICITLRPMKGGKV